MCGCNQHEKKCEIDDIMRERNLDDTKLNGRHEEKFGTFTGLKSGVSERMRTIEGVSRKMSNGER